MLGADKDRYVKIKIKDLIDMSLDCYYFIVVKEKLNIFTKNDQDLSLIYIYDLIPFGIKECIGK